VSAAFGSDLRVIASVEHFQATEGQHTSAYVSIRQHTSAYVSIRPYIRVIASVEHVQATEGEDLRAYFGIVVIGTYAAGCSRMLTYADVC
jgi:hypothetical protein